MDLFDFGSSLIFFLFCFFLTYMNYFFHCSNTLGTYNIQLILRKLFSKSASVKAMLYIVQTPLCKNIMAKNSEQKEGP